MTASWWCRAAIHFVPAVDRIVVFLLVQHAVSAPSSDDLAVLAFGSIGAMLVNDTPCGVRSFSAAGVGVSLAVWHTVVDLGQCGVEYRRRQPLPDLRRIPRHDGLHLVAIGIFVIAVIKPHADQLESFRDPRRRRQVDLGLVEPHIRRAILGIPRLSTTMKDGVFRMS